MIRRTCRTAASNRRRLREVVARAPARSAKLPSACGGRPHQRERAAADRARPGSERGRACRNGLESPYQAGETSKEDVVADICADPRELDESSANPSSERSRGCKECRHDVLLGGFSRLVRLSNPFPAGAPLSDPGLLDLPQHVVVDAGPPPASRWQLRARRAGARSDTSRTGGGCSRPCGCPPIIQAQAGETASIMFGDVVIEGSELGAVGGAHRLELRYRRLGDDAPRLPASSQSGPGSRASPRRRNQLWQRGTDDERGDDDAEGDEHDRVPLRQGSRPGMYAPATSRRPER